MTLKKYEDIFLLIELKTMWQQEKYLIMLNNVATREISHYANSLFCNNILKCRLPNRRQTASDFERCD